MTQRSWPFYDSVTGGTPVLEDQWSIMARLWASSGVINTGDGTGDKLQVFAEATGLQVRVKTGRAVLRGHFYESDSIETLSIGTNTSGNPRIDRVVLRLDPSANTVVLAVKAGTPATTPAAPSLTQTDLGVFEVSLAQVRVVAGAGTISGADVTDERTYSGVRVGGLQVDDNSGGWSRLVASGNNIRIQAGSSELVVPWRSANSAKVPTVNADTVAEDHYRTLTTKGYVDTKAQAAQDTATATANTKVSKSGDEMTGDLVIKKSNNYSQVRLMTSTDGYWLSSDPGAGGFTIATLNAAGAFVATALKVDPGATPNVTIPKQLTVQGVANLAGGATFGVSINTSDAVTPRQTGSYTAVRWLSYDASGQVKHIPEADMRLYIEITASSSSRILKDDIADASDIPDVIDLTPRQFTWKPDGAREVGYPGTRLGLIAEEAAEVDERLVMRGPDGKVVGLDQHALIAALVAKVSELQARVDSLEA